MWKCSSCAVQGKTHVRQQIPCQDKTKTAFGNDTYVIALADGAGSAKLSHFGAECVVDSISDLFVSEFDGLFATNDGRLVKWAIMEKLLSNIREEAKILECNVKDLASTLLAVAVKDDQFIIAHIGDGVIGYLDGEDLKVASAPSNGEYINETYFVTSSNAINVMRLFKGQVKNIAGFVLMSDGTEQSLYNKSNNILSNAVMKLMQRDILVDQTFMNAQLEITFKDVIVEKTYDDCSIAIMAKSNRVLRSLNNLSFEEKCDVYGIRRKGKTVKGRIQRYELILDILQTPASCAEVSKKMYPKLKYMWRDLKHLCDNGLLIKIDGLYYTVDSAQRSVCDNTHSV